MGKDSNFTPGAIHEKRVRSFWVNTLKCPPWVEDILANGYKIPFQSLPATYEEENNVSFLKNQKIVLDIIEDLKLKKVIEFVDYKPHCVSPLGLVTTVVKGVEKHRMVFDASRWVNLHTTPPPVKLVHLTRAVQMTRKGDFQAIFDLRSAYYHIKIAEEHVKYLGAAVTIKGKKQYFVFKHLPFGLNSAVHAITKLMKPIIAYLHKEGIRCSIYIDDGRILGEKDEVEMHRVTVYETFLKAGWQLAWDKSDGPNEAGPIKKYLGFLIDSTNMTVSYPAEKLVELKSCLETLLQKETLHPKQLAKILGKLISMFPSHGTTVRICTRSGYSMLEPHVAAHGYKGHITWSTEAWKEIKFFWQNADFFNGSRIVEDLIDVKISILNTAMKETNPTQTIVSDSSDTKAVVKWLEGPLEGSTKIFQLDPNEMVSSSGRRELLAIHRLLQDPDARKYLAESNILWLTDSTNVVAFLTKGSPKAEIQNLIFDILKISSDIKCNISPCHLFREDERIKEVDFLTKIKDSDNWSVDMLSFKSFDDDFHFELDLFADQKNRKTVSFVSKYYHPDCKAVDAFTTEWKGMCWICPPTSLICQVIKRIKSSKCQGLLIVPDWPASDYYCEIFDKKDLVQPFSYLKVFKPYIFQNEGARNTPLFGITSFNFFAIYFNTL